MSADEQILTQGATAVNTASWSLAFKRYYRLIKPGIVYSNVMTAAAGYLLATKDHPRLGEFLALLFGTALIIASACVFNNYIDRGIDARMKRTKNRALANGSIKPRSAILYALVLGISGFMILSRTNGITLILGLGAIFSYVVLYGYAKRKSRHGTLVGTVPGAASLVAGYTAASGHLGGEALLLFLIMLSWQMAHFYAIAIFRFDDYKAAGLPVMPVVVGAKKTISYIRFYVALFLIFILALSLMGYAGKVYLIPTVLAGVYWLYKSYQKPQNEARWARQVFGISLINLLVFCLMIGLNPLLP